MYRTRYEERRPSGDSRRPSTSHGRSSPQPSLAVRLMQVAGEFEDERKQERQRYESHVAELNAARAELDRKLWQQSSQLEALERKLDTTAKELSQRSSSQDELVRTLQRELIAVKFELADKTMALAKLRSAVKDNAALRHHLSNVDGAGAETKGGPFGLGDDPDDGDSQDGDETDRDLHSREMLFLAAEEGLDEIVKGILTPQPTRDRKQSLSLIFGHALRRAAANGHLSVIKKLAAAGARFDVRSTDDDYLFQTPLHVAASNGHDGVVRFILGRNKEVTAARASAAQDPSLPMPPDDVIDLNDRDVMQRTPLHLAAAANASSSVKFLLLQGADPDIVDENADTPMMTAQRCSATAAVRVLSDSSVLFWNSSVRANRLYNEKRFQLAIEAYSSAISLSAETAMATSPRDLATLHYNRARAAYRLGMHCSAIQDCDVALEKDSSYRNAIAQRAECYMSLFDFDRAARDFQALLDADPTDRQWTRRLTDAQEMRDMTHYQVLGIPVEAEPSTIKKAYRQCCLRWHPDKHNGTEESSHRANIAFRRINEANDTLTDSYKRMLYDVEKRPALAAYRETGRNAEGYDLWYSKEREREAERIRERELLHAREARAREHLERERVAARKKRATFDMQQQLQQERDRLLEAEASKLRRQESERTRRYEGESAPQRGVSESKVQAPVPPSRPPPTVSMPADPSGPSTATTSPTRVRPDTADASDGPSSAEPPLPPRPAVSSRKPPASPSSARLPPRTLDTSASPPPSISSPSPIASGNTPVARGASSGASRSSPAPATQPASASSTFDSAPASVPVNHKAGSSDVSDSAAASSVAASNDAKTSANGVNSGARPLPSSPATPAAEVGSDLPADSPTGTRSFAEEELRHLMRRKAELLRAHQEQQARLRQEQAGPVDSHGQPLPDPIKLQSAGGAGGLPGFDPSELNASFGSDLSSGSESDSHRDRQHRSAASPLSAEEDDLSTMEPRAGGGRLMREVAEIYRRNLAAAVDASIAADDSSSDDEFTHHPRRQPLRRVRGDRTPKTVDVAGDEDGDDLGDFDDLEEGEVHLGACHICGGAHASTDCSVWRRDIDQSLGIDIDGSPGSKGADELIDSPTGQRWEI